MIAISLIVTMIAINWMIAVGFGLSIALFYYLTARFTKSTLRHLGRMHVLLNQQSIQTLQEGLGAVRDGRPECDAGGGARAARRRSGCLWTLSPH